MILVIGTLVIRRDCLKEALEMAREHVARSRMEYGCTAYALQQDVDDPRRLVFVEQWSDEAVLKKHFTASRQFARAITALADAQPTMTVYDAQPVQL